MKVLAKTTGPTLVCLSGDFLDAYEYRIVEYDNRVRDWNNRKLLEIKSFIKDEDSEVKEIKVEEEVKVEEEPKAEEAKVEEEPRPSKKKSRR